MINVKLPDGSLRPFENAVSVAEVAASIGPGLAKAALAGKVNGKARYGLDAKVDGMVYARPKLPPTRNDSAVVSIDDSAAGSALGWLSDRF